MSESQIDNINHPKHYTSHKSGIECIEICQHMSFTLGNAMKYIWRADLKNGIEDLKKAIWYLEREIQKRGKASAKESEKKCVEKFWGDSSKSIVPTSETGNCVL